MNSSNSFNILFGSFDALKASVATFAGSCANKLRGQGSVASCVTVFIGSNPFREDLAQYWNGGSVRLQVPTCDTLEIAGAAMKILESVYRPGIRYKRSGVVLSEITPDSNIQMDLFDPINHVFTMVMVSTECDSRKFRSVFCAHFYSVHLFRI